MLEHGPGAGAPSAEGSVWERLSKNASWRPAYLVPVLGVSSQSCVPLVPAVQCLNDFHLSRLNKIFARKFGISSHGPERAVLL